MGINNVNVLNPQERILTSTASTDTFNRFELGADGSV